MRKVLIVGATSAIAQATARRFAADGDALFLVGRDAARLADVVADLEARGAARVGSYVMDLDDVDAQAGMIDAAQAALDGLDTVLVAYGTLPDQAACQQQVDEASRAWHTNAISPMALLTLVANVLEARGGGTLAAISSVAGERGRKSNYVYGSAKAALSTFLEGLRHRLHGSGVHVLTVKPGLVDTPMTASFEKGALWSTPERVGADIYQAICRQRDVCYTPAFWAWVMLAIRAMPRWLFKRTSI
jgi:decaprenylphospho-beta-D-erythro-pentofuranosid-2-ulose 2-reductase